MDITLSHQWLELNEIIDLKKSLENADEIHITYCIYCNKYKIMKTT